MGGAPGRPGPGGGAGPEDGLLMGCNARMELGKRRSGWTGQEGGVLGAGVPGKGGTTGPRVPGLSARRALVPGGVVGRRASSRAEAPPGAEIT